MKSISQFITLFSIALLSACGGDSSSITPLPVNDITEWNLAVDDELLAYTKLQVKTYQSEGFEEVTDGLTASGVSTDLMRVWINNGQAEQYKNLNTTSTFPVGTTVLRVLFDEANEVKKVTATVKASRGTNPASNDWVFAVTDSNGVVAVDDAGKLQMGALTSCNTCHTTRLDTDGLFGLPE